MIVTTTPGVEGKRIVEYKGIVFGEVISGVDFLKDFAASLSDFSEAVPGPMKESHVRPGRGAGRNEAAGTSHRCQCSGRC